MVNNLPKHLLKLKAPEDCTPDALAFLMAVAAKDQGARAGMLRENGKMDIFAPATN
jgi:hypothetical protein